MEQKRRLSENIEIDLIDLLWKVLYGWKVLIPFALIVGLLVSAVMYMRSVQSYQAMQEMEQAEVSVEMLEAPLTELELQEVYDTVALSQIVDSDRAYSEYAPYMQQDPYNENCLQMKYLIMGEDEASVLTLRAAFEAYLTSDEMLAILYPFFAEVSDTEVSNGDVLECIKVGDGATSLHPMLMLSVVLPEHADADGMAEEIDTALEQYAQSIGRTFMSADELNGENVSTSHILQQIAVDQQVRNDINLANQKRTIQNSIINNRNVIKNAVTAFSDSQQALYQYLLLQAETDFEHDGEVIAVDEESMMEELAPAPSFSKKYFAVGVVLGIFLFALFLFLRETLMPCISQASQLEQLAGLRNFGVIYQFCANTAREKLLGSRVLYRLRYRKHLDIQRQQDGVVEYLGKYMKKHEIKELCFVGLSKMTAERISLLQAVQSQLVSEGYNISMAFLSDEETKSALPDVSETQAIVCVVLLNQTTYRSIEETLTKASDYRMQVIGTVSLS